MYGIDTKTAGIQSNSSDLLDHARREARCTVAFDAATATITELLSTAMQWLDEWPRSADRQDPLEMALGERALADYADAIAAVREPLGIALEAASHLPPTQRVDGTIAPAGTSLHRFSGAPARTVATWRQLPHGAATGKERDALMAYPTALVEAGYATSESLSAGLPGSLLLGLLGELPGVLEGSGHRDMKASEVRAVFSKILDLGDTLALSLPNRVLGIAADLVACDRSHRARRLLATHLELVPSDAEAAVAHAHLRIERDRDKRASRETRDSLQRAAALSPDDAFLSIELARVQRERGDLRGARATLEQLQTRHADAPGLDRALDQTDRLLAFHAAAEPSAAMPAVTPDDDERRRGRFRQDTLEAAAGLYRRYGTLAVTDAFDADVLDACRSQFVAAHGARLDNGEFDGSLGIGDRRFQVSLPLDGAFNDPSFYANGFVLPLMRRLLDDQAIIGSMVCATSLPGARAQHLHKDHRALFTDTAEDEPIRLPPVAVTAMIPLVALDESVGSTEVRKGSHLYSASASERMPVQYPVLPLGGCFLMDLALSHAGQANRSQLVRPIVNMQYTRRWFVDNKNFRKQRPLTIKPAEWGGIASKHRRLFDWACQPGARVDR